MSLKRFMPQQLCSESYFLFPKKIIVARERPIILKKIKLPSIIQ